MQGFRLKSMETSCSALLRDLELMWTEIGETEAEKDWMLLELEKECIQVYKRKVDEASNERVQLKQAIAAKEEEVAALRASLGEKTLHSEQTDNGSLSLKDQLAAVTPLLEELKVEKEERMKLFSEIKSQIDKITLEIAGRNQLTNSSTSNGTSEIEDFSLRKLNEYQAKLQALEKEKSDRLHRVLGYVNEVHCLCGVLGVDFNKTVNEVHPTLRKVDAAPQSSNISEETLEGLCQVISKLKNEKKLRARMVGQSHRKFHFFTFYPSYINCGGKFQLRETMSVLYELWNLINTPDEERRCFGRVLVIVGTPEEDIIDCGVLSQESLDQVAAEVDRLTKLKVIRMKELVFERRAELEEICRRAHMEPDTSTALEKVNALIDSGILDPSELVSKIEDQIVKAKKESACRKEILDRVGKWLAACDEEKWLEDYNQDQNRYSAGRGAHLNLKRAELARKAIAKIPAIVENLMKRTIAWEDERSAPFLYDGIRLVSILEERMHARRQQEDEDRRYREQKKLQALVQKGAPPGPRRCNSVGRKLNGYRTEGHTNGSMTPTPRRHSAGNATSELLTPHSCYTHESGYFKEVKRLPTTPANLVALLKGDVTPSLPSVSSSESGSPLL